MRDGRERAEQDLGVLCYAGRVMCCVSMPRKQILQICNQFELVFRCVQVTVAKRSEFSVDVLSHTSHNKPL